MRTTTAWTGQHDPGERSAGPGGRVVLAVACLLALVGVAVVGSVLLIVEMRQDTVRLTDRQVAFVQGIHDAALSAKAIANHERGYLLTGRREFLVSMEQSTREARAAFAAASRAATSHGQEIAVENARAGFDRWLAEVRTEIETYQAGNRRAAVTASLERARPLRKDYERAFSLALLIGTGAVEAETSSVLDASSRSVTFLLAYLAFALVLGAAVAAWLVRLTRSGTSPQPASRPL